MAWVNEKNAGYRLTSLIHGAAELKGPLGASIEKIVDREKIDPVGGNNVPIARPVDAIDARVVARYQDTASGISETAAAALFVSSFTDAAGNAGSVTVGKMVAGSIRHSQERSQGGFKIEQEFQMEGASLTWTPVI